MTPAISRPERRTRSAQGNPVVIPHISSRRYQPHFCCLPTRNRMTRRQLPMNKLASMHVAHAFGILVWMLPRHRPELDLGKRRIIRGGKRFRACRIAIGGKQVGHDAGIVRPRQNSAANTLLSPSEPPDWTRWLIRRSRSPARPLSPRTRRKSALRLPYFCEAAVRERPAEKFEARKNARRENGRRGPMTSHRGKVFPADLAHGLDAGERHGDVEFVAHDLDGAGDSGFAAGAEAVDIGAARQAGTRPQR